MQSLFYFICCSDYDQDLDIMTSNQEIYKVSINREIEPGVVNIFDVHLYFD